MLLDGLGWLNTTVRAVRAGGGVSWYVRESARERAQQAITAEFARLERAANAARPPFPPGKLQQSLAVRHPTET